jgi:hypothetical protein
MSEQKGSTLARKLANVMGEVCKVPKSGRNDYHKYDYATESDLTEAIRSKLADQGVAILPSVVEVKSEPLASSKRNEILTTATLEITLICAESGESRVTRWQGQGLDAGDKGYYKAYTGAMKYFLMKTFLISTGDDPEEDGQDRRPASQARSERAPQQATKAALQAAGLPLDEWESLMRGAGLEDLKAASAACAAGFKKGSVRDLSADDLVKVNRKLAGMAVEQRREYVQDKIAGLEGNAA